MGISKPTVSKHLATLEQHLQARLLRRSTRGVTLTPSGRRFFDRCQKILVALDEAETEAVETTTVPRGPLKVLAPHCVARRMLIPELPDFLRDFPAITLDLECLEQPVDVAQGDFDLAVQILDRIPPGYASLHLAKCPEILCAAPAYVNRADPLDTPDSLLKHRCLAWGKSAPTQWLLDGPSGREALELAPLARTNSADALRAMIHEGIGIGLLPAFLARDDLASGALVRVLPDYSANSREIRALFAEGPQLSRKVEVFLDYLRPRILPQQSAA